MSFTKIDINSLKENPDNPRNITDAKFQALTKSVRDFPQMLELRPIVLKSALDFTVLGGNMRLRAAKAAGFTELPVLFADTLTPEQQREFIIKDNVGFGEWDWDRIVTDWPEAPEWGLDVPAWANKAEAREDDYEIPDEIETDIKEGDLFEIGQHRLLCGDSTDAGDVETLMNGQKGEILFTSPPYSDMRTYNGNKDLSISHIIEFIPTWMPFVSFQVINLGLQRKENEVYPYWDDYIEKAKMCGYLFLSWNVWDRMAATSIANQSAMFAIYHEWVFVFGKKSKPLYRTWDKSEESAKRARYYKVNEKGQKVKGSRQKDGSIKNITAGVEHQSKNMGTVFSGYAEMERTVKHPAKFPVSFPSEYIKAMTLESEIVAEAFIGSGTTMVAAHQLNRKCYGIEIDPKYCQVIIDRMLKLDPSLVIVKNGVPLQNASNRELNTAS